jgi:hypothetical protein
LAVAKKEIAAVRSSSAKPSFQGSFRRYSLSRRYILP